ncbi:MAG TPA: four helix bundle protein [Candidatus Nanoarchaeia archaeon]|nr:four helix bundle protein [Candidatus Nanoarchaeia archaeon]
MVARNYKNLQIYHLSYDLTLKIYKVIEKFPEYEIKNMSLQLRRAIVSIPLNIAESTSRKSPKEFLNFLTYSYGSAKEVEVLLNLSKDLGYIDQEEFSTLSVDLNNLIGKLYLFMRDAEQRIPQKRFQFFQQLDRDKLVNEVAKSEI